MTEVLELKNPYPGLRPFEPEEADYFFGRDRQVDELLLALREHRFVAVLGLSGSGKSSLVRAGLVPALKAGHLTSAGPHWRKLGRRILVRRSKPCTRNCDRLQKCRRRTGGRTQSTRSGARDSSSSRAEIDAKA